MAQRQNGFADVNGTKLYYEVAGEGHPLVLNHGGIVDHHLWDDQFDALAHHFKVIRYDIRGFGSSGLLKKGMEPYSRERDLYGLLHFLGITKTAVLGLSLGGALAIDFTLHYPEMVDSLIAVGAGLSTDDKDELSEPEEVMTIQFAEMQKALERGDIADAVEISLHLWTDGPYRTPEQVASGVRERMRAMTTHYFQRHDDKSVQPLEIVPPAFHHLAEILVPTLIIVGEQDSTLIMAIAEKLEQEITGSQKAIIPNTAHHPNIEKPQEFYRLIIEFLKHVEQEAEGIFSPDFDSPALSVKALDW